MLVAFEHVPIIQLSYNKNPIHIGSTSQFAMDLTHTFYNSQIDHLGCTQANISLMGSRDSTFVALSVADWKVEAVC